MTDRNLDLWMLIPPGGPVCGPFWGVMTRTGKIIASQVAEREHAELLVMVGNIWQGEFDTMNLVGSKLREIMIRDLTINNIPSGGQDYLVRSVVEAIAMVIDE